VTTPTYLGAATPHAGNGDGLLSRLGSYFGGGGTPVYAGKGQPAPVITGGLLQRTGPAYVAAPVKELALDVEAAKAVAACDASATCPIDPEALAAGHIAIVIPRGT